MSYPTDTELIHQFVDGFIQGQPVFVSNPALRTEPLFDSTQLISGHEIIATAYPQAPPIRMVVQNNSSHGELLQAALLAENFYPLARTGQPQQYVYQYCQPPENYQIHCTTAKELWRICWGRGFGLRSGIPLDLLVWGGRNSHSSYNWRSLRGLDCENGKLHVKLMGGHFELASSELLVWAKQQSQSSTSSKQQYRRPDLRGYYRLSN